LLLSLIKIKSCQLKTAFTLSDRMKSCNNKEILRCAQDDLLGGRKFGRQEAQKAGYFCHWLNVIARRTESDEAIQNKEILNQVQDDK